MIVRSTAHRFSGCDTGARFWGKGKSATTKALQVGQYINKRGNVNNIDTCIDVVDAKVIGFVVDCYGSKQTNHNSNVLRDVRAIQIWKPNVTETLYLKFIQQNGQHTNSDD